MNETNNNYDLPSVAGRRTTYSLAEVERRCLLALKNVQQDMVSPDNFLIDTLCEAIRSIREYCDFIEKLEG